MLRGGYQIIDFSGLEIYGNGDDFTHDVNVYELIKTQKPILISGLTLIVDGNKLTFPDFFASFIPERYLLSQPAKYCVTIYGETYKLQISVYHDNTSNFIYVTI